MKTTLIQRAKFENRDFKKGIDSIVHFDYMGSSEFEWGALPTALKILTKSADKLITIQYDILKDIYDNNIWIIALNEKDADEYSKYIKDIYDEKIRLKECPYLKEYMINKDSNSLTNAWWDIDNNVMFTFGVASAMNLINGIKATRDKKKAEGKTGLTWF